MSPSATKTSWSTPWPPSHAAPTPSVSASTVSTPTRRHDCWSSRHDARYRRPWPRAIHDEPTAIRSTPRSWPDCSPTETDEPDPRVDAAPFRRFRRTCVTWCDGGSCCCRHRPSSCSRLAAVIGRDFDLEVLTTRVRSHDRRLSRRSRPRARAAPVDGGTELDVDLPVRPRVGTRGHRRRPVAASASKAPPAASPTRSRRSAPGDNDMAEILADHLLAAAPVGTRRRAAEALVVASDVAVRRYAFESAEDTLERAVELWQGGIEPARRTSGARRAGAPGDAAARRARLRRGRARPRSGQDPRRATRPNPPARAPALDRVGRRGHGLPAGTVGRARDRPPRAGREHR